MTPTDTSPDDSWSSLAAELGLDLSAPKPNSTPSTTSVDTSSDLLDDADEEDTVVVPGLSMEPVAEEASGESGGEGSEGGEGGKRRRRRRRRRRGGGASEDSTAPNADDATNEFATDPTNENASESDAGDLTDDDESQPTEALRVLVKNWNVPSWDELISGLYRPGN